jgi:RNA polymerase sigma-70 factor (ECF subfamily)
MFDDKIILNDAAAAEAATAAGSLCEGDAGVPSPLEEEVVAIFDQLRDRLLRYLLSLGLSAPDGEEIIQEVFLALFQHLQRGRPRHNLRAWVFQVTHNLALRQRGATRRYQQNLAQYGAAAEDSFVDRAPNPEDQLAGEQRRVRLLGVLHALPEQDRRCLFLRTEGLTYREIAHVLGISLGAVALSLARSLARLSRADER